MSFMFVRNMKTDLVTRSIDVTHWYDGLVAVPPSKEIAYKVFTFDEEWVPFSNASGHPNWKIKCYKLNSRGVCLVELLKKLQ